jgi:hypothetical protein
MYKRKAYYGKVDDMRGFVSGNSDGNRTLVAARDARGIKWMNKNELNEAIPPIHTQLIGEQLIVQILAPERIQEQSSNHG